MGKLNVDAAVELGKKYATIFGMDAGVSEEEPDTDEHSIIRIEIMGYVLDVWLANDGSPTCAVYAEQVDGGTYWEPPSMEYTLVSREDLTAVQALRAAITLMVEWHMDQTDVAFYGELS